MEAGYIQKYGACLKRIKVDLINYFCTRNSSIASGDMSSCEQLLLVRYLAKTPAYIHNIIIIIGSAYIILLLYII